MTILVPDWSIYPGRNQVGNLVRWTSLVDANSVPFLDPGSPPTWSNYLEGERQIREDSTVGRIGFPSTSWIIPHMTDAQHTFVELWYKGEAVTIRDAITANSFSNFNAVFDIEDRGDLADRWTCFSSGPFASPGFAGYWGWSGVEITMTRMESL